MGTKFEHSTKSQMKLFMDVIRLGKSQDQKPSCKPSDVSGMDVEASLSNTPQ